MLAALLFSIGVHPLWNDLRAGSYAVGFRIVQVEDPSRGWEREGARPIPMSVWYPATAGPAAALMPFDDYVIAYGDRRVVDKEALRAAYAAQWFAGEPRAKVDELLRTQTAVRRDAPAAAGRFPLVIYAPGYGSTPLTHTVTLEFLASHGYVVVSSPAFGATPAGLTVDTVGLEAQARDIETLLGTATAMPNVDSARVAAVGYSFGGGAVLLAAMQDARIGAVVSIDGMPGWHHTIPLVAASASFDAAKFRTPLMHINAAGDRYGESSMIESLVFSERFVYSFRDAVHHDFIANPVIGSRVRGTLTEVEKRTYLGTCDRLLTFLNAYLRDDAAAHARLLAGSAEPFVIARTYEPAMSPPSETAFFRMIVDDRRVDEAVALLGRSKVPFISQGMLRLIGDRLLDEKRGADAVKVFEAMGRSYPFSYAWIGLGRALTAAGDPTHAADAYRKALTINQTTIEARERLDDLQAAKDAAPGH